MYDLFVLSDKKITQLLSIAHNDISYVKFYLWLNLFSIRFAQYEINTLSVTSTIMHMEMQNDKLLEFKQNGEGNKASDKSNVVLL